jgi:hypothetical protein
MASQTTGKNKSKMDYAKHGIIRMKILSKTKWFQCQNFSSGHMSFFAWIPRVLYASFHISVVVFIFLCYLFPHPCAFIPIPSASRQYLFNIILIFTSITVKNYTLLMTHGTTIT